MESKELKPCPFCEGHLLFRKSTSNGDITPTCSTDGCLLNPCVGHYYKTKAEAVTAWNTRPSPWIAVTPDSLPERSTQVERRHLSVLVLLLIEGVAKKGYYDFDDAEWYMCGNPCDPSHYMPIPPLP